MDVPEERVKEILKLAELPVSLETPIGDDDTRRHSRPPMLTSMENGYCHRRSNTVGHDTLLEHLLHAIPDRIWSVSSNIANR